MASGYENLVKAHDLELHVVECDWPFQGLATSKSKTVDEAISKLDGTICFADVTGDTTDSELVDFDYLFIGPPEGWQDTHPENPRWAYSLSPNGGYHGLLLAHMAVAIITPRD